jgi:hypothetical protein
VLGATDDEAAAQPSAEPAATATAIGAAAPAETIAPEPPDATPPMEGATAEEALLNDTFDSPVSGWLVREAPQWSAGYVDGRYRLTLHGQPTIGVSAALPAERYRMSVDITINEGAGGIIFLAAQPDVYYRFMLNLDGMYAIEVQHQDQSTVTAAVDWTFSDALQRPAGATYRLQIERQGQLVRFWVDDQPLTSWAVPQRTTSNQYGFAVSSPDGRAAASFDNLRGARLMAPDAP